VADQWDPAVYQVRRDERSRPFGDLIARLGAAPEDVHSVVDLGCGAGNLTGQLVDRFPQARVHGVDSSEAMIASASEFAGPQLTFSVGDVTTWTPDADVIVTNAVLHWVEGHAALLARWAGALRSGGWLAMQVPGNQEAPSHQAVVELMATDRWRSRLAGVASGGGPVLDPVGYANLLTDAGCRVDAWETTYLHELPADGSSHPVVGWLEGTTLRPVISALAPDEWAAFRADLTSRVADLYPVADGRVWFPFRRVFTVAEKL
jgi:trans-aconitate 2-methyltransferase